MVLRANMRELVHEKLVAARTMCPMMGLLSGGNAWLLSLLATTLKSCCLTLLGVTLPELTQHLIFLSVYTFRVQGRPLYCTLATQLVPLMTPWEGVCLASVILMLCVDTLSVWLMSVLLISFPESVLSVLLSMSSFLRVFLSLMSVEVRPLLRSLYAVVSLLDATD